MDDPLLHMHRHQPHRGKVAKCEVDSDFLAKAASHVEKASMQDYGVSDATILPPEGPLDGEWDDEPGKAFSEGNNNHFGGGGVTDQGDRGAGGNEGTPGAVAAAAARAEAINDTLRPLDRRVGKTGGVSVWM